MIGTYKKKSIFLHQIATALVDNNCIVPNDRKFLESLPGVGRKTTNVVLSTLFNEQAFAVDTHIERVAKRLGIAEESDSVFEVEQKLMEYFKDDDWSIKHLQVLLFGRFICKSKNPLCDTCKLKEFCTNSKRS